MLDRSRMSGTVTVWVSGRSRNVAQASLGILERRHAQDESTPHVIAEQSESVRSLARFKCDSKCSRMVD